MGRIITLCTDFGTRDGYVAAMKGIILGIWPDVTLVDITHEVSPQNVTEAAYILETTCPHFPAGTIHLVVVDPGVGSDRRAIALRTVRYVFVAPDNGVLASVVREDPATEIVSLEASAYRLPSVSNTFHGRDLFAPAAAHIARGVSLAALGPPVETIVGLESDSPRAIGRDRIVGCVAHVDRFGDLITDIPATMLDAARLSEYRVSVGQLTTLSIVGTYADAEVSEAVCLVGSHGRLEIAVRNGNAAQAAHADVGAPVLVEQTRV